MVYNEGSLARKGFITQYFDYRHSTSQEPW